MIDLLLIHPPHRMSISGLTLPTLSAFLKSKGYKVVYDEHTDSYESIVRQISFLKPRYIGISVPYTFFAPNAINLIKVLKKHFDIPIVVGGSHVSICPEDFKDADYVCQGYGEKYLLGLLQGVDNGVGVNLDDIPTVFSKDNVKIRVDGFRYLRYMSSRGCVFDCSFCSNKLLSNGKVIYRDIDKVVKDFIFYKKVKKISRIVFNDETFTLNKDRAIRLCEGIKDIGISWWCQTRSNLVDDELADVMKHSGCIGISFGVESGDSKVLKDCSKGISLKSVINGISILHSYGIKVYGGFIIGFPSDTKSSIYNTLGFAISSSLDYAGFGLMMPFPGTKVREQAIKDGGFMVDDYSQYYSSRVLYIPTGLEGVDVRRFQLYCQGRFLLSSLRRFYNGSIGTLCQEGWKPKVSLVRKIMYGVSHEF